MAEVHCHLKHEVDLAISDESGRISMRDLTSFLAGAMEHFRKQKMVLIALSTKLKHPVVDCLFLAVAIRSHAPLITTDRAFRERARPLYKQITLLEGCEKN